MAPETRGGYSVRSAPRIRKGAPTSADILIELAGEARLFHTPDGTGFADIGANGHRETWAIRSRGFKRWLSARFFAVTRSAPSGQAFGSALNVLEARAHFEGPERQVFGRVGGIAGRLYLDLADDLWQAVEISPEGWCVIADPPSRFRRPAGMRPLPIPVTGGAIEWLRPFVNVRSESDFVLIVAWALAALRDRGPYPILVLCGEQGSSKSTLAAILRSLVDPNVAPLRTLPRDDRDLFIAAGNGHLLVFDNVSNLPGWLSDSLCRVATGGGFATRQLYTDRDEVLFEGARPMILNGIEEMVNRPDLADRSIFVTLDHIPEAGRRTEGELWKLFYELRPAIMGSLLDAVAHGLKRMSASRVQSLPRMADFANWIMACEGALWPAGTFNEAYHHNRKGAVDELIDADPVANAARRLMATRERWTGTASDLLAAMRSGAGIKDLNWPDSPRALAGRLRRATTVLREIGVAIDFVRTGRARSRMIQLTAIPELIQSGSSAPSAWPSPAHEG